MKRKFWIISLIVLFLEICFVCPAVAAKYNGGHDVVGINKPSTTWFFAEGYTGSGFDEWLTIQNPSAISANVTVTFMIRGGVNWTRYYSVGPNARETISVNDVIGDNKEVSLEVVSDQPIVAERSMYFNYHNKWQGGHSAVGATSANNSWYFAEGYTGPGFEQWLTLQNPGEIPADITITYMFRGGGTQIQNVTIDPETRETVSVNQVVGSNREVSMKVTSNQPIIAERPMYFNYHGKWQGGHNVMGANNPDIEWYFAEGYTGPGFEEWLTLQNPNTFAVNMEVTYMVRGGGNRSDNLIIDPMSRHTIEVNSAIGYNKEVSVRVSSSHPIIAERSMYFNYHGKWQGGHDVVGANNSSTTWYFAEGYTGPGFDEWLTLQNPNTTPAYVTVNYMVRGGGNHAAGYVVDPQTRYTVKVNDTVGSNREVSMKVTSNQPIIAERPMYFEYTFTERMGKIAYTIDRYPENDSLWLINPDGSNNQKLLDAYRFTDAEWSSSGNKLLASYYNLLEDYGIDYYIPIYDKMGIRINSNKVYDGVDEPSWFPNENLIVFGDYFDGIYETDFVTGGVTEILWSAGRTFDHCPIWSPDGKRLAFVHHEWGDWFYVVLLDPSSVWSSPYQGPHFGSDRIMDKNYNGLTLVKVGDSIHDEDIDIKWTPDGTRLVFSTERDGGTIYVADVTTSPPYMLEIKPPVGEELESKAYLSNRGDRIAFGTDESLYTIGVDGKGLKKIQDKSYVSCCDWSPDDTEIVYEDYRSLTIVDVNNGNTRKIIGGIDDYVSFIDWSSR